MRSATISLILAIVSLNCLFVLVTPTVVQGDRGQALATQGTDSLGPSDSQVSLQQLKHTTDSASAGNITLSFRQHGKQGERVAGSPMLFDAVMENPKSGVSAYDIKFEFNETATTANVSFTDWTFNKSGSSIVSILDNGSSMQIEIAQINNKYSPDDKVVVGQVTVDAEDPGDVVIEPTEASVLNNSASRYNVSFVSTRMDVLENLDPFPSAQGPPRDLTGDGLLEDVNGDGTVDIFDVLTLFNNRFDITAENVGFFNFDGSDPKQIDIFDALELFKERFERDPDS